MSVATQAALDEAIRAHITDETGGFAVAWALGVGIAGDQSSDFYWTGPDDQPGYVSAGLGTLLHTITASFDYSEDDE